MPLGTHNPIVPGCGLHHISIMTQNYAEALRFYRDVLGMPLRLEFTIGERPFALLDMGDGSYIELQAPRLPYGSAKREIEPSAQSAGNPLPPPGGIEALAPQLPDGSATPALGAGAREREEGSEVLVHFALATTDVRGAIEKVRAAGYPITVEPKDVQLNTLPASVAFFTGPSGESVELFQEK